MVLFLEQEHQTICWRWQQQCIGHCYFQSKQYLVIFDSQSIKVFLLAITLCEGGGTLRMVAISHSNPILTKVPHNTFKINQMKNLETPSWHVAIV